MSVLVWLGVSVRDAILGGASWLKLDFAPGLVAAGLVLLLMVVGAHLWWITGRRLGALRALRHRIEGLPREEDLARNILAIDRDMAAWTKEPRGERRTVAETWEEYRETLVTVDDGGAPILRNTVRPALFFNMDDLGFGPGYFRIVPSLFVSVGLFLTFLGLIAALDDMGRSMTSSTGARPPWRWRASWASPRPSSSCRSRASAARSRSRSFCAAAWAGSTPPSIPSAMRWSAA